MRRLVIVLLAVAMAACTTVEHRDYGYYGAGGGDYYHGYAYDSPWYDPYDSLFWGLRYSYYDPFFYPHFYYGVTYFPRYYGWNVGWSSWYAWRYWHPYSPYYGSYWDHYYDWWRYQRPQRRDDGLDQRLAGRRAGMPAGTGGGPVRFGSARNAAERLAWQRQAAGGSVMPLRQRAAESADGAPLTSPQRDLSQGRVVAPEQRGLPSRTYAPRERIRDGSQERDPREDVFGSQGRALRGGDAGSVRGDDGVFRAPAVPERSVGDRGLPSRSSVPAPSRSTSPIEPSRTESRSVPAPRTQRSAPPPRPSRSESRPSTSRDRSTRER